MFAENLIFEQKSTKKRKVNAMADPEPKKVNILF